MRKKNRPSGKKHDQHKIRLDSSSGRKFDKNKPRLSLVSKVALFKLAEVMTDGEKKYDTHNWRKGFNWSRIADAAERHLSIWIAGQDLDPDSRRSNLAHAMACIMMLLEFEETHKHLDDRYKLSEWLLNKLYPPLNETK